MSYTRLVYLNKKNLPTRSQWQESIEKFNFNLVLNDDFDLENYSGGVQFSLNNSEDIFIFEFDAYPMTNEDKLIIKEYGKNQSKNNTLINAFSQFINAFSQLLKLNKKRVLYDYVLSFQFSSSTEAMLASVISSSVLAYLTNGLVKGEDEPVRTSEEALQEARAIILEIENHKKAELKKVSEDRSPALWGKKCLETLKKIHPDYQENSLYQKSSKYFEYVRTDPSKLIISHNFLRTNEKQYIHGFCIMFTTKRVLDHAHTPFHAGARFEREMWKQFSEDLLLKKGDPNYPISLHSTYNWGSNTFQLMEKTANIAETYLLPYYLEKIREKADILKDLYGYAHTTLSRIKIEELIKEPINVKDRFLEIYATQVHLKIPEFKEWGERYQKQYILLSALHKEGLIPNDYKIKSTFLYANEVSIDTSFLDILSTYALEFSLLFRELPDIVKHLQQSWRLEYTPKRGCLNSQKSGVLSI